MATALVSGSSFTRATLHLVRYLPVRHRLCYCRTPSPRVGETPTSDSSSVPTLSTGPPLPSSGVRGSPPPDTPVPPSPPSSTSPSNGSSQASLTPDEIAFWQHLRGQYGYRDNQALRVSLGNLSTTQHALIAYLNDTPTASPGQLAQHIRENPYTVATALVSGSSFTRATLHLVHYDT